jgi:hypothetical protein
MTKKIKNKKTPVLLYIYIYDMFDDTYVAVKIESARACMRCFFLFSMYHSMIVVNI